MTPTFLRHSLGPRERRRIRSTPFSCRTLRALLASLGVMAALRPTPAPAFCHGYEYQRELKDLFSWPERGLYVAHLTGAFGEVGRDPTGTSSTASCARSPGAPFLSKARR